MSISRRASRRIPPALQLAAACVVTLLLVASPAHADPERGHGDGSDKRAKVHGSKDRHHGKPNQRVGRADEADEVRMGSGTSFLAADRRDIRRWFSQSENLRSLPPGLAKRDSLPPGLRRQVQRNGELPPGLRSQLEPLPLALERQLPRLPESMRRVVLGRDVLLVDGSTNRVRDILRDVLPGPRGGW